MEYKSIDDLLQELIDLRLAESATTWAQAELVFVLRNHHRVKAGDLAATINCTSRYISDLARTYRAFPDPDSRVPELTFTHHSIASTTDDPHKWIAEAADRQYSTRELRKAVKGEAVKDELREAQRVFVAVERVLDAGGPGAEWIKGRIKEKAGEG